MKEFLYEIRIFICVIFLRVIIYLCPKDTEDGKRLLGYIYSYMIEDIKSYEQKRK